MAHASSTVVRRSKQVHGPGVTQMPLIRITAIIAAAGYAGRLAIDVMASRGDMWQRRARVIWTLGGIALLLHALAAFHIQHHWSHAAAWEHTRERTLTLIGWNSGAGLYANYAMTLWWLVDLVCWQRTLDWPRRHRVWYWTTVIAFGFLMVNATVVFGPGFWWAIVAAYAVAVVAMRTAKGS